MRTALGHCYFVSSFVYVGYKRVDCLTRGHLDFGVSTV